MAILKFEKLNYVVLFAGNNRVAHDVLAFLMENLPKDAYICVFKEDEWDTVTVEGLTLLEPDIMITCYWPYLLSKEMIEVPKYGTINFHPALLPKNRGWYPTVWEVMEEEAGVTLHLIDEGADTGNIIAQKVIAVEEEDTGGTIYEKSQQTMISLFKETWEKLHKEGIELKEQDHSKATYHTKKEGNDVGKIDLGSYYLAGDLFAILKAKTFGDKSFAYYEKDGVTYKVNIKITKDNG